MIHRLENIKSMRILFIFLQILIFLVLIQFKESFTPVVYADKYDKISSGSGKDPLELITSTGVLESDQHYYPYQTVKSGYTTNPPPIYPKYHLEILHPDFTESEKIQILLWLFIIRQQNEDQPRFVTLSRLRDRLLIFQRMLVLKFSYYNTTTYSASLNNKQPFEKEILAVLTSVIKKKGGHGEDIVSFEFSQSVLDVSIRAIDNLITLSFNDLIDTAKKARTQYWNKWVSESLPDSIKSSGSIIISDVSNESGSSNKLMPTIDLIRPLPTNKVKLDYIDQEITVQPPQDRLFIDELDFYYHKLINPVVVPDTLHPKNPTYYQGIDHTPNQELGSFVKADSTSSSVMDTINPDDPIPTGLQDNIQNSVWSPLAVREDRSINWNKQRPWQETLGPKF